MIKINIQVRAYCADFEISINRKEEMSIDEATQYVQKEIIETAQVKCVTMTDKNGLVYKKQNENYIDPTKININHKTI